VDNRLVTEDVYAGWVKARFDLLKGSVERVYALLSASRVDDEDWRTSVAGETLLWRATAAFEAPNVPPRFATVHRRSTRLLELLTAAGDSLRAAVERRDPDPLGRSMRRLNDAEKAARARAAANLARVRLWERGIAVPVDSLAACATSPQGRHPNEALGPRRTVSSCRPPDTAEPGRQRAGEVGDPERPLTA